MAWPRWYCLVMRSTSRTLAVAVAVGTAPTPVDGWVSGSGRGCGLVDCLKLDRSESSEPALAALAMVGPFDPNHDRHPQLLTGRPPLLVEDILLQEREERLHRSIVTARTNPSH